MIKDIEVIYYCLDEFCKIYQEWERNKLIETGRKRERRGKLSLAEMLTIMVYFHSSHYKDFKNYYQKEIRIIHRNKFKELPCYERFVCLMPKLLLPLSIFMQYIKGEETGHYIIESTKLAVCNNRRISRNKTFAKIAKRGKTSMGWFYGFKLHMVINNKGEIKAVKITRGNVDDRKPVEELTKSLKGAIYADKGYLSKKLFNSLYRRGLKIISGIKSTMKNYLLSLQEKINLRGRFLIETIFGKLKSQATIEHSRHRSPINFIVNTLAALASYALKANTFVIP